jgi:hypothetical protein
LEVRKQRLKENPMNKLKTVVLFLGIATVIAAFGSSAKADEHDKLTIFTFSTPVEIPNGVVLPAGSYVFKLLDSSSTRNIVQIFNEHQTQVYATIVAVPAERLQASDNSILEFYETEGGPENALKMWFYPGDLFGQEFVYSKERAAELAKAAKQHIVLTSSSWTRLAEQPR